MIEGLNFKRSMKIAVAIGLFFVVIAAGTLAFIYAGVYDIAATKPHFAVTQWVLRTVMDYFRRRTSRTQHFANSNSNNNHQASWQGKNCYHRIPDRKRNADWI